MDDAAAGSFLRTLTRAIEGASLRITGVAKFEDLADGLVRIGEKSHANRSIMPPDGSRMPRGAPVLKVNFWNEPLPSFPYVHGEPRLTLRVTKQLQSGLGLLADYMAHPYFGNAQALRTTLSFPRLVPPIMLARVVQVAVHSKHARMLYKSGGWHHVAFMPCGHGF